MASPSPICDASCWTSRCALATCAPRASLTPNPNSALSSKSEFDHAGPRPSLPPLRKVILDLRRDFSVHDARNDAVPPRCRSCWVSIFCEIPGIARSRWEKRRVLPPKRWKNKSAGSK